MQRRNFITTCLAAAPLIGGLFRGRVDDDSEQQKHWRELAAKARRDASAREPWNPVGSQGWKVSSNTAHVHELKYGYGQWWHRQDGGEWEKVEYPFEFDDGVIVRFDYDDQRFMPDHVLELHRKEKLDFSDSQVQGDNFTAFDLEIN